LPLVEVASITASNEPLGLIVHKPEIDAKPCFFALAKNSGVKTVL
jgi:hypothetical protein